MVSREEQTEVRIESLNVVGPYFEKMKTLSNTYANFFPLEENKDSQTLTCKISGIPLSQHILNINPTEKLLLFKEIAIEALKVCIAVKNLEDPRLKLNLSCNQIYIIPTKNLISFPYPEVLSEGTSDDISRIDSTLNTLRATLYSLIKTIQIDPISYYPQQPLPPVTNISVPREMNEIIKKLTYPLIQNVNLEELIRDVKNIEFHSIDKICVFCKKNTEDYKEKLIELNQHHSTHLRCFSEEMTMPVLQSKKKSDIYCNRNERLELIHECEYNQTGQCEKSGKPVQKKKNFSSPVYKCLCDKKKQRCKYPVGEDKYNEYMINEFEYKKNECCFYVIPEEFFKQNLYFIPFSILRKYQILMLINQFRVCNHDCDHKESVPYINSETLKPFKLKMNCKHSICSFCFSPECPSKCLKFKEFLENVGLGIVSNYVEHHLIL